MSRQEHFEYMNTQHAKSGKGIDFLLPPQSLYGDLATHLTYTWTPSQVATWHHTKTLPITLADLPPSTPLTTTTIHFPTVRTSNNDVRITKAGFERLEGTPRAFASVWRVSPEFVLMLPKPALGFTEEQKRAYRDGTIREDAGNAPSIVECMQPGWKGPNMTARMPQVEPVTVGEIVESLRGA